MHCHGGFARACHALDDQTVIGGLADNIVLLFLDGGDDLPQHSLLVPGKVFGQKIVIGNHFCVIKIEEPAILNLVGSFQLQVDFDRCT